MHTEIGVAVIPRVPQEVIDKILGHLGADSDLRSLRSCALVSRSWVASCRRNLFHAVTFTGFYMERWLKAFPVPEEGPAHLVKDLGIRIGGSDSTPEKFFEYTPWFTNVERVTVSAQRGYSLGIYPYGRLPHSTTSLAIDVDSIAFADILDIMTELPNLDNLSLSGTHLLNRSSPPEAGTGPKGRFGGRLRIVGGFADESLVDALLEIPTCLRFTEVEIRCTGNSLLSTARLVEGCRKTLVKLSYTISFYNDTETSERIFDFSKSPNLQEVDIAVCWAGGRLFWIPAALSTLSPTTSPHLSAIKLRFTRVSSVKRPTKTLIKNMGDDLRWVTNEFSRIGREFEGAVSFTVVRDSRFEELDTGKVFQLYGR